MDPTALLPSLLAFQQIHGAEASLAQWLMTIPWYAWVAIVAIVSGCVSGLVAGWQKHRERMEMIRHGMHPDLPADAELMVKTSHPEL